MYIVFYSTSDVFKAEEKLISANFQCKVVPTPVSDKAYCGVCLQTTKEAENLIKGMEYRIID